MTGARDGGCRDRRGKPTGLFLACELRLAGVEPLVLERLSDPDKSDKAHGLIGQSVRLMDPGPGAPMTLTEMADSIERVLGVRVPLTPPPAGALRRLCRRNSRQADRYRDRRVFLAGDAAHVSHGPTLNAAINDAANLAWNLALAVQGRAPADLLDSYQSERHPVGERLLTQTRAEAALPAPGADVTALRAVFAGLLTHLANVRDLAATMAGADVRYDMGDPDPAGWFVPPLTITTADGPHRVAELLRDAAPILLDFTGATTLGFVVKNRARHVAGTVENPPAPALLIRPDGYVAWSGDDPAGLEKALLHWSKPT